MTQEDFINFIRSSPWGIALGYDKPEKYNLLGIALNDVGRYFWNTHQWFFRFASTTFSSESIHEMDMDVDAILELTYADGDRTRYIKHRTGDDRAEKYNYGTGVGSVITEWDEYSYDDDMITIRLSPAVDNTYTVTARYLRKFAGVDFIPEKYHSTIMIGIRGYLTEGAIGTYPPFISEMEMLKRQEKPYRIKKSANEKDRIFKGVLK